ncbi:autotransporter outer membrane beta-barrel domain-containing protein [Nissabacter sp. SGAir0207]|uniref:autotransporter outer membrane beta-barrel domain-containing protein n=1 Tax=Nissabacter sp. SGAir0207 TaxID=2126321 RepID=UPI0010CD3343|nr:autotransporter outer membrane beta-barrel domain-containing protein [Nissabacter sp. SGAir0207]QCR35902.1 autotransporter domain-containing protein [Nissabacter sp. SGAir0207]
MQRKKLLSLCIALAISNNSFAADTPEDKTSLKCPTNINQLTQEQRDALPDACLTPTALSQEEWSWIAGGAVAAALAVGFIVADDNNSHPVSSADNGSDDGGDDNGDNGDDGGDDDGDDVSKVIDINEDSIGVGEGDIGTQLALDGYTINSNATTGGQAGGTGLSISGNDNTLNTLGPIVVDGNGSTGVEVTGNGNTLNTDGDATLSNGGTGIAVTGDSNTLNQRGDMVVGDFATGISVSGQNNTVNLSADNIDVIGQQATGVQVAGESNQVILTGDMRVDKDQSSPLAADNFYTASTGIDVSGSNNTVVLDGHLQVVVDTEVAPFIYSEEKGSQETISGVTISGDGNRVELQQGLQLTGETDQIADTAAGDAIAEQRKGYGPAAAITIDGASTLSLQGDSTIEGDFPVNFVGFALSNGGQLEIAEGASLNTTGITSINNYLYEDNGLIKLFSGSSLINQGSVQVENMTLAYGEGENTQIDNQGSMEIRRTSTAAGTSASSFGMHANNGATAVNEGDMTGRVMNQDSLFNFTDTLAMLSPYWSNNTVMGIQLMTASVGASATNMANGTLEVYGRGVAMNAVDNGTADNFGTLTTDALWKDAADTTQMAANIPSDSAKDFAVGMYAGTDYYIGSHNNNAIATNHQGGVITVYNAGAGMVAFGRSNQVINQGTINLESNENAQPGQPLVGMAVYKGGIAINDTTGVININAENGQAFYSDGNANNLIINRGQINVGDGVPDSADNSSTLVSLELADGTVLSGTTTLTQNALVYTGSTVSNTGTVEGSGLSVWGTLDNESGATITAPLFIENQGVFNNAGTAATLSVTSNGTVNNAGTVATLSVTTGGTVNNSGVINGAQPSITDGTVINNAGGTIQNGVVAVNSTLTNHGNWNATNNKDFGVRNNSVLNNAVDGTLTIANQRYMTIESGSVFKNSGTMISTDTKKDHVVLRIGKNGDSNIINNGTLNQTGSSVLVGSIADHANPSTFWNQGDGLNGYSGATGEVNYNGTNGTAVYMKNSNTVAINDGVMNISGSNTVAMKGSSSAQLINNGTINLGTEGTTDSGMVAMQLDANATANAVLENNGTINIYASDSYAFSQLGDNGRIVNNGTVNLEGTGSGLVKESDVQIAGVNGNTDDKSEVHYANYTLPTDPTAASTLNQYTIGTNADGTAGTLTASNVALGDVSIDTGFTQGSAATTQTFEDVFVGANISGEQNITSTSVVWSAEGQKDDSGNVDVTMTKNAYADVVSDDSVSSVANALDAAYTNNDLFTSLNLKSTAELNSALRQISGSQAKSVARDARVLGNRFEMLADTAPTMGNGLAFNVVAKGDQRSELGNDTRYDMMALRQQFALSNHQTLSLEYGIARLDGDGDVSTAGDNGVTGGYSQFFGVQHSLPLTESGLRWNNALRYDIHNLDSNRQVQYGNVNRVADSDNNQQYLEFRSEMAKSYTPQKGLTLTPFAGMKLRHTTEEGYNERGAGDFNLRMSGVEETAVDAVAGLKLTYAGDNGWAATATLEGGPNLSYQQGERTASLQGAAGQRFRVEDGQKGGGVNGLAQVGVKYQSKKAALSADAYHWQEDGLRDTGLMVNYRYHF